jgi:tryptophan-rich sensory protein
MWVKDSLARLQQHLQQPAQLVAGQVICSVWLVTYMCCGVLALAFLCFLCMTTSATHLVRTTGA